MLVVFLNISQLFIKNDLLIIITDLFTLLNDFLILEKRE